MDLYLKMEELSQNNQDENGEVTRTEFHDKLFA